MLIFFFPISGCNNLHVLLSFGCAILRIFFHSYLLLSDRARKVLESRSFADDERIDALEAQLKEARYIAEDTDRKYDEVLINQSIHYIFVFQHVTLTSTCIYIPL